MAILRLGGASPLYFNRPLNGRVRTCSNPEGVSPLFAKRERHQTPGTIAHGHLGETLTPVTGMECDVSGHVGGK